MAQKRSAQQAFGTPNGQLSAVAAAKQAKQRAAQASQRSDIPRNTSGTELASSIANTPYNGHREGARTPDANAGVQMPAPATTPPRPSVILSNVRPNENNTIQNSFSHVELSLKSEEFVTFIGEYRLEVLKGVVSIQGAMLHPNSGVQRVYAMTTQALPAVVARKNDSVIRVTSPGSRYDDLMNSLKNLSPLFSNIGAGNKMSNSFELLVGSSDDTLQRPLVPLEIDDDMRRVFSRLNVKFDSNQRPPRVMAVGAKSSGKSTFNRLLCNMVVTRPAQQRCYYLDLDPGQPEFGPPGQLSLVEVTAPLLGPSYTHLASGESKAFRLIRSHTIAATSFKDDPGHYVSCVAELHRWMQRDVPVVVNSCGWVNGLGASVLGDLATTIGVSDIVALGQLDRELEDVLKTGATIHQASRRQGRTSARTPAELRAMQTMAYFHQNDRAGNNVLQWNTNWNMKRISKMRPWNVGYFGPNAGIEAILSYGQAPQPDFLSEVLDGSIVAIVQHDDNLFEGIDIDRTANEDLPYIISKVDGFSFPVDPHRSKCLGLALIRGIDKDKKKLHLVTPLAESLVADLMQQKVVLVRGGFDCPEWAYLEDLYGVTGDNYPEVPEEEKERPWVTLREPVGVEGSVWRLRHPPTRDSLR